MKWKKAMAALLVVCMVFTGVGMIPALGVEHTSDNQNVTSSEAENPTGDSSDTSLSDTVEDIGEPEDQQDFSPVIKDTAEKGTVTVNSLPEQAEAAKRAAKAPTAPAAANSLDVVYVSAQGNDDTGAGTVESPVATLSKAVGVASKNATIYVMSDLTMTESASYYGKNLTITSYNGTFTVTRGEGFAPKQDSARSTYNPAMIEVNSTEGPKTASLKLSNIVFDDSAKYEGEYFVQADSEGDGHTTVGSKEVQNTAIVQDGIIATYNNVGTITLGEGAVLKNYGGMSAVRIASGELIMEAGSQIIDEKEITRVKGATGSFGPAGAVWIQGGILNMNGGVIGGADNTVMTGRAVYVDGGTANVGGTLQNLKGTDAAWQGQNGVAVHLRSGGEATLTETGKITNVTGTNTGNNSAIWTQYCNFTSEKGSLISKVDGFPLLHFDDLGNDYSHEVYLDGTISDCKCGGASLLRSWYGQITFGEHNVIENCSSSSAGGLIYSNNGSHYTFAGTIRNNTASKGVIYLANQGGGGVVATIESTAKIVDNSNLAIRVNNSSNLTMNGGEISGNKGTGVQISGKDSWKGVKFIMNDGTIADNGGVGIDAAIGGNAVVQLNGGSVHGNGDGTEITVWNDYTDAPGAYGKSENDNIYIASGVLQGNRTVKVMHGYSSLFGAISMNRTLGTVTLDDGHGEVAWAFANPKVVDKITNLVTAENNRDSWKAAAEDAYWITPYADSYQFKVTRPDKAKKTDLYLAYIPMNDDGSVPDDAELTLEKVGTGNQIDVTMEGLDADKSYAFMFFNSSEYTLTADSVTKYIGGGAGNETTGNGFPELTIGGSVDPISKLEIKGVEVTGDDLMSELLSNIEATYTNEDGDVVTDDSESGEYTVTLKWKNGLTNDDVRINGNNVNLDGIGTVIVRHISDVSSVQAGTNTHELLTTEPTAPVEHAEAIAKTETNWGIVYQPDFYINDNEDFLIEDASGIQILDDGLLLEDDDNRQELMEQKVADYLGAPGEGQAYRYDFHYLDLVDAFNGNAWVSASYGTTVYLPYPEGVTADNAEELGVKVVHYRDLHREYGISGQAEVEEAIAASELETMEVEFDANGIKFDVPREGFSPFAVIWQTEAHTITATAGEGGTVDPSGEVVVAEGADKTFTITPDKGYEIVEVVVDGQAVGLTDVVNEDGTGTYTFEKVDGDHSISITFEAISVTPDPGEDEPDNPADNPNTPSGDNQQGNSGDNQQDNSDKVQSDDSTKTGDEAPIALLAILLIASGTALVAVRRRR